jgi:hypothetical protein
MNAKTFLKYAMTILSIHHHNEPLIALDATNSEASLKRLPEPQAPWEWNPCG